MCVISEALEVSTSAAFSTSFTLWSVERRDACRESSLAVRLLIIKFCTSVIASKEVKFIPIYVSLSNISFVTTSSSDCSSDIC